MAQKVASADAKTKTQERHILKCQQYIFLLSAVLNVGNVPTIRMHYLSITAMGFSPTIRTAILPLYPGQT